MIHGEEEEEEEDVNGGGGRGESKEWGKGKLLSKSSEALLRFMGWRYELYFNGIANISILLHFFQSMNDFIGKYIFLIHTMMDFNGILCRVMSLM